MTLSLTPDPATRTATVGEPTRTRGSLAMTIRRYPQPLARARRASHQRKLDEYEARRKLDPGDGPRGAWLTLDAGIGHEREWVRFLIGDRGRPPR